MFKKLCIISVAVNAVLGILLGLLSFYLIFLPALEANAAYKEIACVYSDSAYDFVAPTPEEEQVEEMKNLSFIKSVYEYYICTATVSANSRSVSTDAMFSQSDNLDITPFNDKRLLSQSNAENALYLSQSVASTLKAKVGDSATVSIGGKSYTFEVGKIFLDDDGKNGKVIFTLTEEVKDAIFVQTLKLAAVYIEAEDVAATRSYLNTYIPLGGMFTREYFDSDLQYASYVEEYKAQDHSGKIIEKSVLQQVAERINADYLESADQKLTAGAITVGAAMLLIAILNLIAILAYDKYTAEGTGFLMGLSWKTMFVVSLFAQAAALFCAALFGLLYSVTTVGMLFVNSFNVKVIVGAIVSLVAGDVCGVLINTAVCAIKRK